MKKLIFCLLILTIKESYSQITLDFQSSLDNLYPVKLTDTETKYCLLDQVTLNYNRTFTLYNLDGTFYKTIQMPPKPDTTASVGYFPMYISRTLFDTDPSNIEYIVEYEWDSLNNSSYYQHKSQVIREDGTILLDEMNGRSFFFGQVYSTEEGAKLMIGGYYYANGTPCEYTTKVFNLPGELLTNSEDKSQLAPSLMLYPNPNNGSFYIKFNSNIATDHHIELYSPNGKLIDTYQSSGNPTHITNLGLSDGMYLINTRSKRMNSTTKMLIKK